jgi:hypothetical protein
MRNRISFLLISFMVMVLVASAAHAATFATMFDALKSSVTALGGLLKLVFPVAGFGCLGFGLFKFIQNNPQDTMFDKLVWVVVGGCLLGIAAFAAMSSESMGLGGGSLNF